MDMTALQAIIPLIRKWVRVTLKDPEAVCAGWLLEVRFVDDERSEIVIVLGKSACSRATLAAEEIERIEVVERPDTDEPDAGITTEDVLSEVQHLLNQKGNQP